MMKIMESDINRSPSASHWSGFDIFFNSAFSLPITETPGTAHDRVFCTPTQPNNAYKVIIKHFISCVRCVRAGKAQKCTNMQFRMIIGQELRSAVVVNMN